MLLQRAEAGDAASCAELLPLIYSELRRLAHAQMQSERKDHTLQTTALVHEAFIRLTGAQPGPGGPTARGSRYFFAAAAEAMRRILVEHARARAQIKHGGDGRRRPARLPLTDLEAATDDVDALDILRLDEALTRLESEDADAAQVVRLRFFAGLNGEETAQALAVSSRTVERHWAFARARLFRLMRDALSP